VAVRKSVFAVDGDEARSEHKGYADELVGTFRSGHQDARGNPRSLEAWRVTSDDPDVVEAVSELLGGTAQEWDSEKEPIEAFTEASTIAVIFEPESIRSGFALWGNRSLVQRCDGEIVTWSKDDPDDVGKPCACAGKKREDRRKAAKNGTGCKPDVSIVFSLAALPDLGKFRFNSGSEILLEDIQDVEEIVASATEPRTGSMTLEKIVTNAGKAFTKTIVALDVPKKAPAKKAAAKAAPAE
jgi:hypothetical protein